MTHDIRQLIPKTELDSNFSSGYRTQATALGITTVRSGSFENPFSATYFYCVYEWL